jgi:RHS repeat-associated protein
MDPGRVYLDEHFESVEQSFGQSDPEENRYIYHSDHLGSSAFLTDIDGTPTQHLQYLPFGEPFIEQRSVTEYYTPYTFSAKERDLETSYSYFGARYYDAGLSIWLSVDPLSDKYPSMSAYMYCAGNPVMLVDPDGREMDPVEEFNRLKDQFIESGRHRDGRRLARHINAHGEQLGYESASYSRRYNLVDIKLSDSNPTQTDVSFDAEMNAFVLGTFTVRDANTVQILGGKALECADQFGVHNNSSNPIYVLPEQWREDRDPWIRIEPGESFFGQYDGVEASNAVIKVNDFQNRMFLNITDQGIEFNPQQMSRNLSINRITGILRGRERDTQFTPDNLPSGWPSRR